MQKESARLGFGFEVQGAGCREGSGCRMQRGSRAADVTGVVRGVVAAGRRAGRRAAPRCMLVPEPFQIRTSFVVHLRFSWYKFKTEDFYNCFTGHCFKICTTKILDGPEKTF